MKIYQLTFIALLGLVFLSVEITNTLTFAEEQPVPITVADDLLYSKLTPHIQVVALDI